MKDHPAAGLTRPAGAPRLTKDGVDLDARDVEAERIREEAQREEIHEEIPAQMMGVLGVVEARRRARLAAAELEHVLGGEFGDPDDAIHRIRKAEALLAGAVAMLAAMTKDDDGDT